MDSKNSINIELQTRIGRNLLLIQKIEHHLKHIVFYSKISGNPSRLKDIQNTREEIISKMSMGQVLSQYLNHIDPSKENNQENPNDKVESIHISCEIDFNFSQEEFEKKVQLFSVILEERNDLVHHFFHDLNKNSIKEMEHKLDEQKNRLLPVLEDLKIAIQMMEKVFNSEYLKSSFVGKALYYDELLFNGKLLILELAKVSIQNDESDGWISLGFAGIHVRNIMPEEVDKLKDKYGYKTLKPLIQNTKMFELKEDTNKNMVLYRLTSDWKEHLRQINDKNNP